jgi:hypothetical protein
VDLLMNIGSSFPPTEELSVSPSLVCHLSMYRTWCGSSGLRVLPKGGGGEKLGVWQRGEGQFLDKVEEDADVKDSKAREM